MAHIERRGRVTLKTKDVLMYESVAMATNATNGVAERLLGDRSELDDPNPRQYEVAILIIMGSVGMIANFSIIVAILVMTSLRRASNAFLAHHCLLDFLKAGFCLPFAQSMVSDHPPLFCSMLGGAYIVVVTSSTFNLLAVVMNEAYLFSDLMLGVTESRNYCCVIFGIFIIWFASIIMNLGVAFIPGNPIVDRRVGHCIFVYGLTRNYVLHILWITLITMGVALTCMYLHKFRLDINRVSYYRLSTLIRATVSIDSKARTSSQRHRSEVRDKRHVQHLQRTTLRKLALLVALVALFVMFWYPLFFLTVVDPNFYVSVRVYKALTLLAWSNPTVAPFIIMLFIKKRCCCCCCYHNAMDTHDILVIEANRPTERIGSKLAEGEKPVTLQRGSSRDQETETSTLERRDAAPPSVESLRRGLVCTGEGFEYTSTEEGCMCTNDGSLPGSLRRGTMLRGGSLDSRQTVSDESSLRRGVLIRGGSYDSRQSSVRSTGRILEDERQTHALLTGEQQMSKWM